MHPALTAIAAEIERSMLRDRHRLRRRLDALRHRQADDERAFVDLAEAAKASSARRSARDAARPRPTYPADLPVAVRKDEIARAIAGAQVVVVCGETGSGKTTQLPKICLELGRGVAGLIGHTQPRRLAARTLAARIASELDTEVGNAVGYKIRFTDRVSDGTYIKLMTDGILLAETQGDRFLEQYDTIIIDEAHERSINIDFLLGYLKRLLPKRLDLKVIVTSATIDPARFAAHFGGAPIIEVSGRVYPVEVRYRPPAVVGADDDGDDARSDDDALLRALLDAVRDLGPGTGDALVFLPGEQSIREAADALRKSHTDKTEILPLYARLSAGEQARVFRPHTGRRIVLATNVAETSLTVPGVRYVIDTGLARVSRYDTRRKVQRLPIEKISQASAQQRAGRAGRTSAGVCIRLYSEEDFASRPVFTPPEIVRTNLASVILQMATLGLGNIEEFPFVEPPGTRAIRDGAATLFELGALDEEHRLTRVGRELARLPVDPRVGRIILGGRDHGCLLQILVIAAALSVQDPRYRPHDAKEKADQAHRRFRSETSDFVSYLKLWDAFQEEAGRVGSSKLRAWCETHFLSFLRMREWQDVHRQLHQVVRGMGFPLKSARGDDAALHRALLTGYLGNIAMRLDEKLYVGARNVKMSVFPGSALFKKRPEFILAAEIVETARLYARTVARIEPEWIEPLAEHLLERRYFEPHWDKARGQVVGFEKVTLHGLPIVKKRPIDFARIDADAAREIFIREALVTGELRTPGAFLRHNRDTVASIEALADRARRRDLMVDEEALYVFYDRALPADVWSAGRFEAWRKKTEKNEPRALYLSRDDVLVGDAAAVTADQFPDALLIAGSRFPLTYRFEPGHEEDGITVTVPLAALGELDAAPFEWLVPGLVVEKATALLESLPKAIRKNFVPVRETAERFAEAVRAPSSGTESLIAALASYLETQRPVAVPPTAFLSTACPEHLDMRFRVVDEQGKPVATSRDLGELKRRLGARARESFVHAARGNWERERVTAWDFGDLPEQVAISHGSFSLPAYPALVPEKDAVALRVFQHAGEASAAHRRGVRRLYALRLGETTKVVRRNLPGMQAMSVQFAMVGSGDALRDDIVAAAIDRACMKDGAAPRTKEAFERSAEQARGRLATLADEVCARVAPILAAYQEVVRLLPSSASSGPGGAPWNEIRDHLARLIYAGFVSETPWTQLGHLPRYLKAARLRIERLRHQPAKDRVREAELLPHWRAYTAHADAEKARGTKSEELERYRWLLEEWRVSLFAQELRTAEPVSAKKIAEQWARVIGEETRR